MQAVDTNALVRLIADDHPTQVAAVRSLIRANGVWISKTVLLESAWVLSTRFDLEDRAISQAFMVLLGLPEVHIENAQAVAEALVLVEEGLEFADALHLTGTPPGTTFATFDKTLVRRAKRAGITRISAIE